jgi:hypothetical protein
MEMAQFLVHTGPVRPPKDSEKSIIYSHVAKHTHRKTRRRGVVSTVGRSSTSQMSRQVIRLDDDCLRCLLHANTDYLCKNCDQIAWTRPTLRPIKGNSDPFASFGCIELDAHAHRYVVYACTLLEAVAESWGFRGPTPPLGFVRPPSSNVGSQSELYDLAGRSLVKGFKDEHVVAVWSEIVAYSSLGYSAACMARQTGQSDHHGKANFYANRCQELLSQNYIMSRVDSVPMLDFLVHRLFKFSMALGAYAQADYWSRFLRNYFEQKSLTQPINRGTLTVILYQENGLSLCLWRDPVFDTNWLVSLFRSDWTLAGLPIPSNISSMADSRDVDLFHQLHRIMISARVCLQRITISLELGTTTSPGDWYWYASYSHCLQMKLFCFYCSLERRQRGNQARSRTMHLTSCLTLATIYALRHSLQITANGSVFELATAKILQHLDEAFEHLTLTLSVQDWAEIKEFLLYISFVASLAEHQHSKSNSGLKTGTAGVTRWMTRLESVISQCNLHSWNGLEIVLRQFPYTSTQLSTPSPDWLNHAFQYGPAVTECENVSAMMDAFEQKQE